MINSEIVKYIENYVFPKYEKNDGGHGLEHIKYVIDRSMKFAKQLDSINYDMVYVIASYHDVAHHVNHKEHERISSEMLFDDNNLRKFFSEEEMCIMRDAVYDHRASMDGEPRSIYGKIVSSADRNINIDDILKRTYTYRVSHFPDSSVEEIINESLEHIRKKFGSGGYASNKMYFIDEDYNLFLSLVDELVNDESLFRERYIKVNNIIE